MHASVLFAVPAGLTVPQHSFVAIPPVLPILNGVACYNRVICNYMHLTHALLGSTGMHGKNVVAVLLTCLQDVATTCANVNATTNITGSHYQCPAGSTLVANASAILNPNTTTCCVS